MTEYMKRSGAELENMRGNSEILHTDSLYSNYYAKKEKNMKSSEVKQGTYRHGEEDQ